MKSAMISKLGKLYQLGFPGLEHDINKTFQAWKMKSTRIFELEKGFKLAWKITSTRISKLGIRFLLGFLTLESDLLSRISKLGK